MSSDLCFNGTYNLKAVQSSCLFSLPGLLLNSSELLALLTLFNYSWSMTNSSLSRFLFSVTINGKVKKIATLGLRSRLERDVQPPRQSIMSIQLAGSVLCFTTG